MRRDLFAGTRTPRTPDDLRERTLRAARAAARDASAASSPPWGFSRLDLAWMAALLVLVLCHALLSLSSRPPAAPSTAPQANTAATQLERELGLKGPIVVASGRETGKNGNTQGELIKELERL